MESILAAFLFFGLNFAMLPAILFFLALPVIVILGPIALVLDFFVAIKETFEK